MSNNLTSDVYSHKVYRKLLLRNDIKSIMMLSPIQHVDAKKLTVTVPKGKGSYDRTVPIAQRTIDALNDYLEM
jgi:site-specific recombinase XerC